jgi:hypothetical protein
MALTHATAPSGSRKLFCKDCASSKEINLAKEEPEVPYQDLSTSERNGGVSLKPDSEVLDSSIDEVPPRLKCPYYLRNPSYHQGKSCKEASYLRVGGVTGLRRHIEQSHARAPGCECCRKAPQGLVCGRTVKKFKFISAGDFYEQDQRTQWELLFKALFPGERAPAPYQDIFAD